jgi:hypothetical protein
LETGVAKNRMEMTALLAMMMKNSFSEESTLMTCVARYKMRMNVSSKTVMDLNLFQELS